MEIIKLATCMDLLIFEQCYKGSIIYKFGKRMKDESCEYFNKVK